MNRVELAGIVAQVEDPRETGRRIPVLDFTTAVTDARWNPETRDHEPLVTFVRCHVYGDQVSAVLADGGLAKGDSVYLVGRLSQRQRENSKGVTERKTHVEAVLLTVLQRRPREPADPWQPN